MPSLGFLKKKRTREGDPNHNSSASTTQPTSPVTPTSATARSFDHASTLSTSPPQAQDSLSHAVHKTAPPAAAAARPSDGEKLAMNSAAAHLTAPYAPPAHSTTPSPGTDPSSLAPGVLPSIANLIHPQQQQQQQQQHDDGTSQQQQPQSQQQPNTAAQDHQQQHQQSSLNQPTHFPVPPANGGTAPGTNIPPQQQQQPSQQEAAVMHQQPTPAQTPLAQQAARQTKGKYSLADFEILRTLGTGSFGRVHLVQSRHNQRFYAVKVLKKAQVVKMKQVEHTNDERKMLGEVKHPFLITLWGTFQDSRNLYMVMDFVEGGELFSLLRKSGVCAPLAPFCQLFLGEGVLSHVVLVVRWGVQEELVR